MRENIRKFRKHKRAVAGLSLVTIEILLVIILPFVMELDPITSTPAFNAPPGAAHLFGTDDIGRDLFARVIYGGRVSLKVGIFSTVITVLIGLPAGLIAGYYRGMFETVIMRTADIFMAVPSMILILVVVTIFKSSVWNITVIIGVLGWPSVARLIYGNVLSVTGKEYIEAARVIGTGNFAMIFKYILPNSISPLWMTIAFRISQAMMTEAGLSFLGAGVQPPNASWGNIIYAAQDLTVLTTRPWVWLPPGIIMLITVMSINLVGEGIRDTLDPKTR